MSKFPEYKNLSLPHIDKEILQKWEEENTFARSISTREGNPAFVFYEGPPSANGLPGIHHVMARTVKDIFCRYKTLKGFQVKRKGGWDTHGLPVELQVEKMLGITKEDIGKSISIADYNKACRNDVLKFKHIWDDITQKMGYWVDLDNPYITFENDYIESVWNLLKRLHDKQFLYKGYSIQPYSPAAGTGLSSHELNLPGCYKDIKDTSCVAAFQVERNEKSAFLFENNQEDVRILAWTTTPWTLPSNTALAVGEKITYVKVRTFNPYTHLEMSVILAEDLLHKYFSEKNNGLSFDEYTANDKDIPYRIIEKYTGKSLLGISYTQLLPYVVPSGNAFRVIAGDFVSTADGTGVVHIAPTFGSDDYRVAKQNDIVALMVKDEEGNDIPLVDKKGRFVKEMQEFAGEYVKEQYLSAEEKNIETQKQGGKKYLTVDERIVIQLKKDNKCFKAEKYEHSYPHCWRTDKPVLYYPLDNWFIKTTAAKERMVALNKTINWKPESTGSGRFGNWLENLVDWNLSRSRYWGVPLPIWRTEDGKEERCIGSIEELKTEAEKAVALGFLSPEKITDLLEDLHKPYVDEWVLVSDSGKPMYREKDLIDVWFDSGAMPFAQWHYPFENQAVFRQNYPADFIAEGVDQTRGWFFTLHAISVMLEDSVAFKNVLANGLVLDKEGNKMSKSKGNVVNPFETIEKYGADATRWYLIGNAAPWENLKFNIDGIDEVKRKFFGTLYNTYTFFALYANLDDFQYDIQARIPARNRPELDQWILSCLNTLILQTDTALADYDPTRAIRLLEEFLSEKLSNWYVRLSRRRFWKGELNADKLAAFQTLYECLKNMAVMMSAFAPFYSEKLYRDLTGGESVHLAFFPEYNSSEVNSELEERMEIAQALSSMIHAIRKKVSIKVRQPLQRVLIPVFDSHTQAQIEKVGDIIRAEVNIKHIEFIAADDENTLLVKKVKPNFKLLGPKLGAVMKEVGPIVGNFTQKDIRALEKNGSIALSLSNGVFHLLREEADIVSEDIPGWSVNSDGKLTVALDITLTPALKQEGVARELVNRIQNLRKTSGLDVTDAIHITLSTNDTWNEAVMSFKPYICEETICKTLELSDHMNGGESIEVFEAIGEIIIRKA